MPVVVGLRQLQKVEKAMRDALPTIRLLDNEDVRNHEAFAVSLHCIQGLLRRKQREHMHNQVVAARNRALRAQAARAAAKMARAKAKAKANAKPLPMVLKDLE